eukprot:359442-Chlamydomonas_euryale.AAC.3
MLQYQRSASTCHNRAGHIDKGTDVPRIDSPIESTTVDPTEKGPPSTGIPVESTGPSTSTKIPTCVHGVAAGGPRRSINPSQSLGLSDCRAHHCFLPFSIACSHCRRGRSGMTRLIHSAGGD